MYDKNACRLSAAHFKPFALGLLLALLAGCAVMPRTALEPLVQAKAERYAAGSLPQGLAGRAASARILVLGESHYVEEHQSFLADLATGLEPQGYNLVLQEGMSSLGWIAEDYVQGELDALGDTGAPKVVAAFDRLWLDRVRAWNLGPGRPDADRIHVGYFDMNHWGDIFQASLRFARDNAASFARPLPAAIASRPEFDAVLVADPFAAGEAGRAAYRDAVLAFKKAMEALGSSPDAGTARWAGRLARSAADELASLAIREDWSDEAREAFIFSNVQAFLAEAAKDGGGRVILNCGMNHAQKEAVLMGPRLASVARRIGDLPEFAALPSLRFIVAVAPVAGEWIQNFQDKTAMRFNLLVDSPEENLLRLMGEAGAGEPAYLDLGAGELASEKVLFEDRGGAYDLVPGRVFDALVALPAATVPASLAPYRTR